MKIKEAVIEARWGKISGLNVRGLSRHIAGLLLNDPEFFAEIDEMVKQDDERERMAEQNAKPEQTTTA